MPRRGDNIRKRRDGRWEGRYIRSRDADGKARYGSVYAKTYGDVKQKLNETRNSLPPAALSPDPTAVLFGEIAGLWLESRRLRLKPQSYADYRYVIQRHLIPSLGDVPVQQLDAERITAFLLKKSTCGRLDGNGGLSPVYVKKLGFIITAAIRYGAEHHYCAPLQGTVEQPRTSKRELVVLSVAEQQRLTACLLTDPDDNKVGMLLSLYAGLRVGEVCGLRWEDVDFTDQTIHVRRTAERIKTDADGAKTALILCDTKTASSNRVIPIPPNLTELLRQRRGERSEYVLKGNTRPYADPRTCQYSLKRCLAHCRLRPINYHALRHTFATRCIESGMDVKSLSELLGHAGVNVTLNTYVHSSLEHKRNQLENMSSYCGQ